MRRRGRTPLPIQPPGPPTERLARQPMQRAVLPAALATGPPRLHVNPPVRLSLRRCLPHRPLRSSIACGWRLPNPQHERLRGVEMSLTKKLTHHLTETPSCEALRACLTTSSSHTVVSRSIILSK